MNKKGSVGVGSASIMLIFTVLCLTVFSLISYTVATNEKTLIDAEARLLIKYYEADALAEHILAGILEAETVPGSLFGVEIDARWDPELAAEAITFSCPISDTISLIVMAALYEDSFDILIWRMWNVGEWAADESLNVWRGPED